MYSVSKSKRGNKWGSGIINNLPRSILQSIGVSCSHVFADKVDTSANGGIIRFINSTV